MNIDINLDVLERRVLFMLDDVCQCTFVYWLNHETSEDLIFNPNIKPVKIEIHPPEDAMESIGYPHRSRRNR